MPRSLYVLLLAFPAALIANLLRLPPLAIFILAALALIPLAGLISVSTETLADAVGEQLGGLLNATFGNAAELIIGITALAAGLPTVVRAAIAGSIIGNALLVLGSAMACGGWRYGVQRFDARVAGQYATMLALAVVGLVIPSVAITLGSQSAPQAHPLGLATIQGLSIAVALVLLGGYIAYIAFSVFGVHAERAPHGRAARRRGHSAAAAPGQPRHRERGELSGRPPHDMLASTGIREAGDRRKAGEARLTSIPGWFPRALATRIWAAAISLAVATVLTAVASELLVGAIEPVAHQVGLSQFFIGLIVLPIVGNAAEHASAITAALRDRMEISMAITAGSSIQIALLVTPVLVLIGRLIGSPLALDFNGLELVIFALVAVLYALISLDGESTWLEGIQLLAFYVIVAASAFFVPT
jgi:Ca2+:H+ antiporter